MTSADGRLVVVTGASSGIGRATATLLAHRGYRVILMARGRTSLGEAVRECRDAGAPLAEAVPVDVADAGLVQAAMNEVQRRHGGIDAVLHCAGVAAYGRVEDIPVDVFDAVIRTNVLGSVNVARSVLPSMRARNRGTLVLTGSVIGHIAVPRMTPYVVSKWAVRSLAHQLQLDNRDRNGVHVCLVEPGPVDTPIYLQAATYQGRKGRPPPPVVSPERVAGTLVRLLDRPRKRVGIGPANPVLKGGFLLMPKLYDAIVGPLFSLGATDPRPAADDPGNVLRPIEPAERLRSQQVGTIRAVAARAVGELGKRVPIARR